MTNQLQKNPVMYSSWKKMCVRMLVLAMMLVQVDFAFCATIQKEAYDIKVDGIYYKLNKSELTATVTYQYHVENWNGNTVTYDYVSDYKGIVSIPSTISVDGESFVVKEISYRAFYHCPDVTDIEIPETVTSIGMYAFEDTGWYKSKSDGVVYAGKVLYKWKGESPSNTSVEVADGTVSISNGAFENCYGLSSIVIPNSVESIGNSTFKGCESLSNVTLPNSIVFIGNSLFSGCSKLGSIVIPNSVAVIYDYAFADCSELVSVTLSNTLTAIASCAFQGCTSLSTIDIPQSVQRIGYEAFQGCTSLSTIDIPQSVQRIDDKAFEGCTNLASITINNPDIAIATNAFDNTMYMTNQEGVKYVGNILLGYNGTMPENTTLTIREGTTTILDRAFSNCSGLVSLSVPNTVTKIGANAFSGCTNLSSVTLSNNLTSISEGLFSDCSNLQSIIIPSSVTSIKRTAFWRCSSLKSIVIPQSVSSIETMGDSGAFMYCSSLESISVESGNPTYDSRDNCNAIIETSTNKLILGCKNTSLPASVIAIGDGAFWGCTGLTSFIVPNTITEFGDFVFIDCDNLETLSVNQSIIGNSTFNYLKGLKELNLGNSVTTIGEYSFMGCSNLTSITIPGNVTLIGTKAFSSTNITTVEFQHTKEQLDALTWATTNTSDFKGTSGTTFKFSSDVTNKVNINYFQNQREDGFRYWANANKNCFGGIEGVTLFVKITNNGDITWVPVSGSLGEENFSINAPVYDKTIAGILDLSQVNTKSNGNGNSYPVTSIGAYAYYQCPNITGVIIGNSVTSIGREAFAECTSLESATIGNGLTYLSRELFRGDSKLTSVNIPEGITTLEIGVFCDCTGLTSVTLPNSLTAIGTDVFYDCPSLELLAIPEGVTRIENSIFSRCNNLTAILPQQLEYIGQKTLKSLKCAVFTSERIPEIGSGSNEYTINQISVPSSSLDAYKSLFGSQPAITSWVGYKSTPVKVIVENTPVTSCKVKFISYKLQNDKYIISEEDGLATGLDPESAKDYSWTLKDGNEVIYKSINTGALTFETQPAQAISNTTATMVAKTNGEDNALRFGFEWRRYDAPEEMPSNIVYSQVDNGVMEGGLSGLSANTYYKYRPFYKSEAGNSYYGDWIAFLTTETPEEPVVVKAKDYTIKYGDELPKFEYTSEGTTLEGTPSITCEATKTSPVGTYAIVITKGGVSNNNATFKNGTLTIEKAPLKITAKSYTIKQGDALPTFEATYEGFKNNETSSVLTKQPTITTTATSASAPGEYDITVSGAEAQNYEISYVTGKLTIEAVEITPITGTDETSFKETIGNEADLENTVVDNTYFNLDADNGDGYDATEQALVLNTATTAEQMTAILNAKVGDAAVRENFCGIIFEIPAGKGVITVDTKTIGTHVLNVQIGNGAPTKITKSERGTADVEYNVTVPTYVYLYASTSSGASARLYRGVTAGANSVLLYGYKATIGGTGIGIITIDKPVDVYNIQGQKVRSNVTSLDGLPKGVYIINGKKVVIK